MSQNNVIPLTPKKCPRCEAPTKDRACTRCTWPNESWCRVLTTIAKKQEAGVLDYSAEALEDIVANFPDTMPLKDDKGRMVMAKVITAQVHDGQSDVTFEFDPKAWKVPVEA